MFWAHYPLGLIASILCWLLSVNPAPGPHHPDCLGKPPAPTPSLGPTQGPGQARASPWHEASRFRHSYFVLSLPPWTLRRYAIANAQRGAPAFEVQNSGAPGAPLDPRGGHISHTEMARIWETVESSHGRGTGCGEGQEPSLPSCLPTPCFGSAFLILSPKLHHTGFPN